MSDGSLAELWHGPGREERKGTPPSHRRRPARAASGSGGAPYDIPGPRSPARPRERAAAALPCQARPGARVGDRGAGSGPEAASLPEVLTCHSHGAAQLQRLPGPADARELGPSGPRPTEAPPFPAQRVRAPPLPQRPAQLQRLAGFRPVVTSLGMTRPRGRGRGAGKLVGARRCVDQSLGSASELVVIAGATRSGREPQAFPITLRPLKAVGQRVSR